MELTEKNLENHGWLFSPSLCLMVREHEAGRGRWDVEVDLYIDLGDGVYAPTKECSAYDKLKDAVDDDIRMAYTHDWIHGDLIDIL